MPRIRYVLTAALLLATFSWAAEGPKKSIALTFDDLPLADQPSAVSDPTDINQHMVAALRKHHAVAIGFVNEKKLETADRDARIAALKLWLDNGLMLGNHTYSHPDFNRLTLEQFIADTERGEVVTRQLLKQHKQQLRYFRYPFNHAGNDAAKKATFQKWLADHGYSIATCTVETADYQFNRKYVAALAAGDTNQAAKIRTAYLDFTDAKLRFFETASKELAGRDFPQVYLAHANRLNADTLDEILTRMERANYRFVTIDEAQSDPIYLTPDNYVGDYGPMWVYRWAPALGKKIDGRSEPEPPAWATE